MNKRLYKFVTHCVINLKYTKTNLKVLEMNYTPFSGVSKKGLLEKAIEYFLSFFLML